MTDDPASRLRTVRKEAGFANAADAAEALGMSYATYVSHENGSRGFRHDKAELYARRFKVSLEWLLTGKGQKEPTKPKGFLAIDDDYDEEIEREVESYRAFKYAEKREKEGASLHEGPRNDLGANRTHR